MMNTSKLKKIIILLAVFLIIINAFILWRHIKTLLFCSKNTIINIVAHEDDDLLFLSPDLIHDIEGGKCVRTIFITSGDAGSDSTYWLARENGSKTAYASMSKVDNIWVENSATIENHKISIFNLKNNPKISLIFLRLPDGNFTGSGFPLYSKQSLMKLWQKKINYIYSVDGLSHYNRQGLINMISQLINIYSPKEINTQDLGQFDKEDHSDHKIASLLAHEAEKYYLPIHKFISYEDYGIGNKPINISSQDALLKTKIFLLYSRYDSEVFHQQYSPWLIRQYKQTLNPLTKPQ